MGEAKKKAARLAALREKANGPQEEITCHMTVREQYCLAVHGMQGATESGPAQFKLLRMFEKLDLVDMAELLVTKGAPRLELADFSGDEIEPFTVDTETVDYVIELCTPTEKRPMTGMMALTLARLIQRLKDAKLGTYVAPPAAESGGEAA